MRVPTRKGDKIIKEPKDYYISLRKYKELESKLILMLTKRPILANEVKRLAEMGDFSENAGYQLAKSSLRGLNRRIDETQDMINKAEIIEASLNLDTVNIGQTVSLINNQDGSIKSFKILGGSESNPALGIISHLSPLGSALLGKNIGDIVKSGLGEKQKSYQIISIEAKD